MRLTCSYGRAALTRVLLDTHAWAWSLSDDPRLSMPSLDLIASADAVFVSPISFFEIAQKVRLGKWPEMDAFLEELPSLLRQQGGLSAALEPAICIAAGVLSWSRRDPFDRLLAATAKHYSLPLIFADTVFDEVVTRIW